MCGMRFGSVFQLVAFFRGLGWRVVCSFGIGVQVAGFAGVVLRGGLAYVAVGVVSDGWWLGWLGVVVAECVGWVGRVVHRRGCGGWGV